MLQRASDHERALRDELVERARSLKPLLSRNATRTDSERRVAEENIAALKQAGLFRLMLPRRYGGHQVSMRTNLDVVSILAEACGASAWVLNLINNCGWIVGLMSERAQDEIFGADPDARVAGVFAPSAQTRRVDGGLVVSGKWYWASGSLHASWGMLGLIENDANGRLVDQYLGFAPMRELSIEYTWYVSGMRGTGSNCLVAEDVFIPDHRLMSLNAAVRGSHATERESEPLYRSAFIPVVTLALVGPQLGLARAALDQVIESASRRNIPYTVYARQAESPAFQLQVAAAAMQIDSAHLHAYRAADDIDGAAARAEFPDFRTRARIRADAGYVARTITEALNTLVSAHGAGAFAEANPLQRIWRDANTAARHALVLPLVGEEIYGKALLGMDRNITPLI
ncbi:MAG: acyl-CoA dehydrogenase family protein [Rudaea sp.]|uniref:acyl-CoA dehydrogenase family protein n=1 Tax=Rudaea sp. TaxID=2136325 RepID=UPI0039E2C43C